MFDIVDPSVPYVTARGARPRDTGPWLDLDPDRLEHDADGAITYVPGDGSTRGRLAHLGIRRVEWEMSSPERRKLVIETSRALDEAMWAIRVVLRERNPSVVSRAEALLKKIVATTSDGIVGERGLREARKRARAFARGKLLIAQIRPTLAEVKKAGGLKRRTFISEEWCAARAREINAVMRSAGVRETCASAHVGLLRQSSADKVARLIVARALNISADVFRYESLRSRARPARRRRAAR